MANTSNAGRTPIARRSSELVCGEENVQATPETQGQGRRGANVRRTGSRRDACSPFHDFPSDMWCRRPAFSPRLGQDRRR